MVKSQDDSRLETQFGHDNFDVKIVYRGTFLVKKNTYFPDGDGTKKKHILSILIRSNRCLFTNLPHWTLSIMRWKLKATTKGYFCLADSRFSANVDTRPQAYPCYHYAMRMSSGHILHTSSSYLVLCSFTCPAPSTVSSISIYVYMYTYIYIYTIEPHWLISWFAMGSPNPPIIFSLCLSHWHRVSNMISRFRGKLVCRPSDLGRRTSSVIFLASKWLWFFSWGQRHGILPLSSRWRSRFLCSYIYFFCNFAEHAPSLFFSLLYLSGVSLHHSVSPCRNDRQSKLRGYRDIVHATEIYGWPVFLVVLGCETWQLSHITFAIRLQRLKYIV